MERSPFVLADYERTASLSSTCDFADGKEIIWMSERDRWNQLYLYNGATGAVKNKITNGP